VTSFETVLPRDFRVALTRPLRQFYVSVFISCFALGLTLSLYIVYLHNVHHFSVSFATGLLSMGAVIGLASSGLWGTVTDRIGPVPTMLLIGAGSAAALTNWAFIESRPQAIVAAACLALFNGGGFGPGATLLTRLCPPEHRQRAYALNFMMVNLGVGLGGLVSAAVVDLTNPLTFRHLYLLNMAVSLCAALVVAPLWRFGRALPVTEHDPVTAAEGWSTVIKDRILVLFVAASLVMMIAGYGSMEAGYSLFVVNEIHLSVHDVGLALFFNAVTIVGSQLFIASRIAGRSRMRVLALTAVTWAVFWFTLAATLAIPKSLALVAMCGGLVIFAVGEALMSPVGSAFVNDLAPEHLRGRYNAANGLIWGVASTVSPVITGLYFGNGLAHWWPVATGITALVAAGAFLALRTQLSPAQDGLNA